MSPCTVIVREVAGEDVAQVRLAQNEDVVQTFTPHRTGQPLHERILPRTVRRREDFLDAEVLHSAPEPLAIDVVAIAEAVLRRGCRSGVHDLLGRPVRGGVLGHVEVDNASAMVGEHNEDEEHPQADSGDGEEIDEDQVPHVISKECAPRLRRRSAPFRADSTPGRRPTCRTACGSRNCRKRIRIELQRRSIQYRSGAAV